MKPRYPIYVPSKGRADKCMTAMLFQSERVPFKLVVEPQEADAYGSRFGEKNLLLLPKNDGGLVYSRNWIKRHSTAAGDERHWQFDDDIRCFRKAHKFKRIKVTPAPILCMAEDFCDRYENVALASFNSTFFLPLNGIMAENPNRAPFYLNYRCYTCFLVLNAIPHEYRGQYNEDTDMTLQVLSDGWCTILFNVFTIDTEATLAAAGGNTTIYTGDGRLRMARALERVWPGVVTTKRKFRRPQHHIKGTWKKFDNQLRRKPGLKISSKPNDYGLRLVKVPVGQKSKTPL